MTWLHSALLKCWIRLPLTCIASIYVKEFRDNTCQCWSHLVRGIPSWTCRQAWVSGMLISAKFMQNILTIQKVSTALSCDVCSTVCRCFTWQQVLWLGILQHLVIAPLRITWACNACCHNAHRFTGLPQSFAGIGGGRTLRRIPSIVYWVNEKSSKKCITAYHYPRQ